MKHSVICMRLPLSFDEPTLFNAATVIYDDDSTPIAHIQPSKSHEIRKQRAKQIVKSVNCHDELVAALKQWMLVESESRDEHPCPDLALRAAYRVKAKEMTRAILSKTQE